MGKKKGRIAVKDMKFRNDPMIRFYEATQEWLQERGRPIVIVAGVIVGLILLYLAGSTFLSWRENRAAAAFAAAFEKYSAPVMDSSTVTTTPVDLSGKTYTDEKTKWQETAEAFERLAGDYSGYYGEIGRYYAGVSYLHFDRDKGLRVLQDVAGKNDGRTSDLARLALAENHASNNEIEKAIEIYEKLLGSTFIPKQAVQLELGRAYEKAGDKQKAVEAYFEAAKAERATTTGSEAERKLSALAPDRVKELPVPETTP
jgi:tetratricopeptide (TPR) repeat protein